MAKTRRGIGDLIQEETKNLLETPNVTDSVSNKVTDSVKKTTTLDEDIAKVTELHSNNVTDSVVEKTGKPITELQSYQDTELQSYQDTELQSYQDTELQSYQDTELQSYQDTELQSYQDTELQSYELPKYLKLERKEARLREEQIDRLTDITRKLNRTKQVKGGERITDNTLIRIAIDLLISRASELQGTTEEELRNSLNL